MPFPVEWQRELGVLDSPTTVLWQDVDGGDEFVFTGPADNVRSGIFVLEGSTGLGLAPAEQVLTDYAAQDGSFLSSGRSAAREIQIPLYIWGDSRQEFLRLENALSETMDPAVPRRLVIRDKTFPRIREKFIECYYSDGWSGDEAEDASGLTWRRIGLELKAPDPWFREDGEDSFTFSSENPQIIIPELLGGLAWPTFHFHLPYGATDPVVTNLTTGESFRLNIISGAAISGDDGEEWVLVDDEGFVPDVVEVNTAPRFRTVRLNGSVSWTTWDFSSDWFTVRSGDALSVSVEEDPEYQGWSALMTINPYHRKGV